MRIENLMDGAKREVVRVGNQAHRDRATSLIWALQGHIEHTLLKILDFPAVRATHADDGLFVIEWTFADKRLGFVVEPPPNSMESSWFLIAADGTADSGLLRNGGMDKLVERFLLLRLDKNGA